VRLWLIFGKTIHHPNKEKQQRQQQQQQEKQNGQKN